MIAAALTDAEKRTWLATNVESDLTFLWSEAEIDLDVQYRLGAASYTTVRRFVNFADDKPAVRVGLIADFALDPAAAAGNRAILATVLSAWDLAKEQLSREQVMRAEARASRMPRPMSNQEQVSMRRVVERRFGPIPLAEQPSAEYLSTKIEEVESNSPAAARLDEVTSMEHAETQSLQATVAPSGNLMVLHKKCKTTMPLDPESFRMRMRIEAHLWLYLAAKFSNRTWLIGLTPSSFSRYTDHFLGAKCNGMTIPSGSSGTDTSAALNPPWAVVLNYEFACRRMAFTWVREDGITLDLALQTVVKDAELKENHFTSPIALMHHGVKRPAAAATGEAAPRPTKSQRKAAAAARKAGVLPPPAPRVAKGGAGKGGKGGAGKGGGKGGKGQGKLAGNTPDGRQICFAFNSEAGCSDAACSRAHVCRNRGCFGAHPYMGCTAAGA